MAKKKTNKRKPSVKIGFFASRRKTVNLSRKTLLIFAACFGVIGLVTLLLTRAATPTILYVDKDSVGGKCSDEYSANQAMSLQTPWCSLDKALKTAPGGSTVHLRQAVYPATAVERLTSRSAYTTFKPQPNESVTIDSLDMVGVTFVRFEGITFNSTVNPKTHVRYPVGKPAVYTASHHVQIINNKFKSSVIGAGSSEIAYEGNIISNPTGYGIVYSSSADKPAITNTIIRGNIFNGIGDDAIQAKNYENLLVENNEFTNIKRVDPAAHPDVFQSVVRGRNLTFRGNNIHHNEAQGLFIKDGDVDGVVAENNVFHHTTGMYQIVLFEVRNISLRNNTVWDNQLNVVLNQKITNATVINNIFASMVVGDSNQACIGCTGKSVEVAVQANNIIAGGHNWGAKGIGDKAVAPNFINAADGDYRLTDSSAGIDAGTSGYGAPSTDKNSLSRVDNSKVANTGTGPKTYFDIGAFENQNSPVAPQPVPSPSPVPNPVPSDTSPSDKYQTVEAETFPFSTSKARVIVDQTASGGQALQFLTNYTAQKTVFVPQKHAYLTFKAKGIYCGGVTPIVNVKLDGKSLENKTISTKSAYSIYTVKAGIVPGKHTIALSFINNKDVSGKCNGSVTLDSITLK